MRDGDDEETISHANSISHTIPMHTYIQTVRGDNNVPIRVVHDTRQCIVPSRKRRQQSKKPSRFDDWRVRFAHRVPMQVADAEKQESEIEGEEKDEESDCGAECGYEENGCKDEPALFEPPTVRWEALMGRVELDGERPRNR